MSFTDSRMRFSVDALPELPSLHAVKKLSFDTETTAEPFLFDRTLSGISYYLPDGRKNYVPINHPGGGNYTAENVRNWIKNEFRGKELVVANAKHEVHTMRKWGIDLEDLGVRFMDVFHQAALVKEKRFKVNLELLAQEEFQHNMIDIDHATLWQRPAHEVATVAIEDAEITWNLHNAYAPRIKAEDLEEVLQLENEIVYSTCEMERNGAYLDVPLMLQWSTEIDDAYNERIMRIYQATGLRVNPNAADDLSKFFKAIGLVNLHMTDGGESGEVKESFAEDVLLEFINDHELVRPLIEARQLASLKSKYIKPYLASARPDGRIYYSLHQLRGDQGTITGRYSSSKMYKKLDGGCNIQQVVKTKKMPDFLKRWPIRKLFIAPEGEEYISSDARQIEYRIFTHYAALCKDPQTDRYMTRLADIYAVDPLTDFHNTVHQWTGLKERDHTKNVNFCKLYGGGVDKILFMINQVNLMQGKPLVTRSYIEKLVKTYNKEFPEATVLMKAAEQLARTRGYVRTMSGRRRRYNVLDKSERFYSALNAIFQGGAADLAKKKILRLYRERKVLGLTLRSQVHDEINGTIKDRAKKAMFEEVMNIQEYPLKVPILWETGIGANWNEAH